MLAGCADDGPDSSPATTAGGNPVATFQVVDETFKVELATPELADHARRLLAGEELAAIPLGTVVRDDPGVNAPWSWHIDPATLEFADMTIEVCDGLPSLRRGRHGHERPVLPVVGAGRRRRRLSRP